MLSDRGNTREKSTHPAFHFVDLDLASVKVGLLACAELSEGEKFDPVSTSIHNLYRENYNNKRVLEWLGGIYEGS